MKSIIQSAALVFCGVLAIGITVRASESVVQFPKDFESGVHYATVFRGDIRQDIYTSQAAIDAVKQGQPIPSGTVITLADIRDGKIFRYVAMEKRAGWGANYPPEIRNGEWEFQAFNADKTVNVNDNSQRCMGCHAGQANRDHVFTIDRIRSFERQK